MKTRLAAVKELERSLLARRAALAGELPTGCSPRHVWEERQDCLASAILYLSADMADAEKKKIDLHVAAEVARNVPVNTVKHS